MEVFVYLAGDGEGGGGPVWEHFGTIVGPLTDHFGTMPGILYLYILYGLYNTFLNNEYSFNIDLLYIIYLFINDSLFIYLFIYFIYIFIKIFV